jgi:hypothetical protein
LPGLSLLARPQFAEQSADDDDLGFHGIGNGAPLPVSGDRRQSVAPGEGEAEAIPHGQARRRRGAQASGNIELHFEAVFSSTASRCARLGPERGKPASVW